MTSRTPPSHRRPKTTSALRAVAVMEAVKGAIVFGAGFGLLALLHRDVLHIAEALVTRLHLDPDRHATGLFLDAAARVTDARLWGLAALALAYSILRAAEAWGLWAGHRWGEWLGAASGAIYVPVEVYELWHRPSPIRAATLALNVAVVVYLLWSLWQGRPQRGAGGPVRDAAEASPRA